MMKKTTTSEKPSLNKNLKKFWKKQARVKVLYGGRSSSKSWDASAVAIILSRWTKLKFLCCRQFQNKIEESVYTLLKFQIYRFDLKHEFDILKSKIIHKITGSEFIFYGLWLHIDEIRSTEGIDVCWIEEAHNLLESQWQVLNPTLRKEGSQFWIIFNPQLQTDFVYQRFVVNPPRDSVVRKINYDENPYLSETIINVIEETKKEDYEEFQHIYLGEPLLDDDNIIIKRSWIIASVDAHKILEFKPQGLKRIGFDIADDGGDRCVNVLAHGSVCIYLESWKANEDELLKSCRRTWKNAQEWNASVIYDSTGVGASAGAKFNEINDNTNTTRPIKYQKFHAGAGVVLPDNEYKHGIKNGDMFANLKAQAWWSVADRLRNTWDAITNGAEYDPADLITIDSEIDNLEQLITELSTPKKDYNNADKIKVESKKDLLKREVNSPDLADAFIMAFAPAQSQRGILDVLMAR